MVAGATITYSMLVTNTGNVTLDASGSPTDHRSVSARWARSRPSRRPARSTTSSPGGLDAGHIENTATAYGNPPFGDPVDADDDVSALGTVDTLLDQQPSVTLDKTVGKPSVAAAGGTLPYVRRHPPATSRSVDRGLRPAGDRGCPVTTLAPATTTCTATYRLTQADLDLGRVTNHATVSRAARASAVGRRLDHHRLAEPAPDVPQVRGHAGPGGEPARWSGSFVVTNVGNVTLTSVRVSDPMLTGVTCPTSTLAPEESVECTADPYTVTPADAARGTIVNTAVVGSPGRRVSHADEDRDRHDPYGHAEHRLAGGDRTTGRQHRYPRSRYRAHATGRRRRTVRALPA